MQSINKHRVERNKLEKGIIINLLGGEQNDLAMIEHLAKKFSAGTCFARTQMGEGSSEKWFEMAQIAVQSLQ